jgi:hypothetical protein
MQAFIPLILVLVPLLLAIGLVNWTRIQSRRKKVRSPGKPEISVPTCGYKGSAGEQPERRGGGITEGQAVIPIPTPTEILLPCH